MPLQLKSRKIGIFDPLSMHLQNTYIIIPVFDHNEFLRKVILDLQKIGFANIIVIDDGSAKDIYKGIADLGIHFLRHKLNLGQGAALQTGFNYARKMDAELVVSFDADGQHSANDVATVLKPVYEGAADICLGSRFLSGNLANIPTARKHILKIGTLINYFFASVKLTDAHNGLRALNKLALDKLNITENRMAHATEILIQAKKSGLRITEVPVTIYYTEYSKRYGQSSWNSVRIFIDLILYKLFA